MVNDSDRSDLASSGVTNAGQRAWVAVAAVVAIAAVAGVIWMRGGSDESETVTAGDASDTGGSGSPAGAVRVQLEPVDGVFVEGFEIGLRFETAGGDLIGSTLWSDHVASLGDPDMEAYYESVLEQQVPAGTVVLRGEVNVGIGPPPSVPDLDGELPCRLEVEVAPDEVVNVEVSFDGSDDCLRLMNDEAPDPSDPEPTDPTGAPSSTEPTGSAPTSSTSLPTTSVAAPPAPAPEGETLAVGTSHYVDVDLECHVFVLEGTWVLVDGDPSSWQPPDERHEGGTFTIESSDRGRFVGDAAETKVAAFRRLGPTEEPACPPAPRPGAPG